MQKFKSKVDELIERLRAEGKVTTLTDEEIQAINDHIEKDMTEFRYDLHRKFKQAEKDLHSVILNA